MRQQPALLLPSFYSLSLRIRIRISTYTHSTGWNGYSEKSTRRGSLFGKLIGSYVIFSDGAAILLLIVAVLISFSFFPMET